MDADLTEAIDPVHAMCATALRRVRAEFADARARVTAWDLPDTPRYTPVTDRD